MADSPGRGREVVQRSVAADMNAPAAARRALAAFGPRIHDDLLERGGLALTEVVTNSVQHAGLAATDRIELSLTLVPEALRVEVCDDGPGFLAMPVSSKPNQSPGGWGLWMVDRLADRWGVDSSNSTRVWIEFDRV
jgi:anti-sigma regulatory factor (Ser/Thr protein kinase)